VDPRVSLDAVENKKILHCWESNMGHPDRSTLLYSLIYPNFDLLVTPSVKQERKRIQINCRDLKLSDSGSGKMWGVLLKSEK
jgi:hypothetical protein